MNATMLSHGSRAVLLATLILSAACGAKEPPARPTPPAAGEAAAAGGGRSQASGPRPFRQVVPASARVDSGMFIVHRTDDKLFFQIPDSLFGREMLLISRVASVPANYSGFTTAGMETNSQVLTFERMGNRVLVRKQSYQQVAADTAAIVQSVVANNLPPIVASFPVAAIGPDSASVVLDVTEFYEGDTPLLSPLSQAQRRDWGVRRLDTARSYISRALAFPENVNVRHTLTYDATSPPSNASTGSMTIDMNQSLVLLPRDPMRPRYADARVGYFSIDRVNFGLPEQKAATQTFIRRWRLEPSDPAAYARGEVVEPVEPITYYLDPATPPQFRSCVRQGVIDWQPAFETAGFRNAIVALDPPSPEEDPDWDPEDVRNSVVRWAASLTRNAMGPSTSDPRTGEIIESDIVWYHNHLRSYRNRIMIETGASNPGARSLPIDDGLMCEAMRQVIAHEIGHALGLPHNMVSSSAYPVDSLRSKTFAARMGVAPSVMDYARQNYIAQPGDGLAGGDFIRQIGPYDHYAINWGYRVIPNTTPESEREVLNRWILEKADDRMYKYLPQGGVADPRSQTEDIGDDPVRASGYGIANLKRVVPQLVAWTTKPGEDYTDLAEIYGETLGQWQRYIGHVTNVIGGVYTDFKTAEQDGAVYEPVPRGRQKQALDFIAAEVFRAPTWLLEPDILSKLGSGEGGFTNLSGRQTGVLNALLSTARLARMAELSVTHPNQAYPVAEYLEDVRAAVWGDPATTARDAYRRALQRAHVARLATIVDPPPPSGPPSPFAAQQPSLERTDVPALARAQLVDLRARANAAVARTTDRVARAHLRDIVSRIDQVFEGR